MHVVELAVYWIGELDVVLGLRRNQVTYVEIPDCDVVVDPVGSRIRAEHRDVSSRYDLTTLKAL